METQVQDAGPRPAWPGDAPASPPGLAARRRTVRDPSPRGSAVRELARGVSWHDALVAWPGQCERRERLAAAGQPRLLVVEEDHVPPAPLDELEDWVRAPYDADEAVTRWRVLEHRRRIRPVELRLDDSGLLRHCGRWVALSAIEEATAVPLVARAGRAVPIAVVTAAYEAAGGAATGGVPAPVARIRRKAERLGLRLHVLSNGAILLEVPGPEQQV